MHLLGTPPLPCVPTGYTCTVCSNTFNHNTYRQSTNPPLLYSFIPSPPPNTLHSPHFNIPIFSFYFLISPALHSIFFHFSLHSSTPFLYTCPSDTFSLLQASTPPSYPSLRCIPPVHCFLTASTPHFTCLVLPFFHSLSNFHTFNPSPHLLSTTPSQNFLPLLHSVSLFVRFYPFTIHLSFIPPFLKSQPLFIHTCYSFNIFNTFTSSPPSIFPSSSIHSPPTFLSFTLEIFQTLYSSTHPPSFSATCPPLLHSSAPPRFHRCSHGAA